MAYPLLITLYRFSEHIRHSKHWQWRYNTTELYPPGQQRFFHPAQHQLEEKWKGDNHSHR